MTVPFNDLNKLFVNGDYLPGDGGSEEVLNPATEEVLALAPIAGAADTEAAIAAARHAFDQGPWRKFSARERGAALTRFHDELKSRVGLITELLILEAGAIRGEARSKQVEVPLAHLRVAIELGQQDMTRSLPPVVTPTGESKMLGMGVVVREPIGVVAAITAYNYPFLLNLAKIGPALMMGNTVILKPSPFTPFSALILGDAARAAELPDGVLNILNGGADLGQALTTDPRIDCVTFTGSDIVGGKIAAQAAPTLKRVLLELGGKSPLIIRADADRKMAVANMLRGFTSHAGQGCGLFTRLLVDNKIRSSLVEEVGEKARLVRVGDPSDGASQMGPLIRAAQRDRVEQYVELGRQGAARLVTGGGRPDHLAKGYYFEPTLFDDVDNSSAIAQDEIFGPVGVVVGFDADEQAITLANEAQFGLRAGILSANTGLAYEMARDLRSGHIQINGGSMTAMAMSVLPFGGMRRSGYGREGGLEGLQAYTEVKGIEFHAG